MQWMHFRQINFVINLKMPYFVKYIKYLNMKNSTKVILTAVFGLMVMGFQAKAEDFPAEIKPLMQKYTCFACHKVDARLVGPAYQDVAKKKYSVEKIVALIAKPQPSNWPGYPPMAPMTNVPKDDAVKIAKWINSLR
jgi:cytochrome c